MASDAVTAPKGSKCAACLRFEGGACHIFRTVVDHHGRAVPIKHCGGYLPPAKPQQTADPPEE